MDSKNWLNWATIKLKSAGIGSARLDALILLEDTLLIDRANILAESKPISSSKLSALNKKLERRANHEPLSFIRQKTEFFGREFFINKDVLEPRPESETMIELLSTHIKDAPTFAPPRLSSASLRMLSKPNVLHPSSNTKQLLSSGNDPKEFETRTIRRPTAEDSVRELNSLAQIRIVDVGTGSGALAITAKLEISNSSVTAIDIDKKCLAVAKKNAQILGADIKFLHGNLLEPLQSTNCDILLANLPYVPDKYKLNPSAYFEPRLAIFGGKDGLDVYRKLFEQIKSSKQKPRFIFTESLPFQHEQLAEIAQAKRYKQYASKDFIQIFSVT
jgi:release factor glutamine methyltransferase